MAELALWHEQEGREGFRVGDRAKGQVPRPAVAYVRPRRRFDGGECAGPDAHPLLGHFGRHHIGSLSLRGHECGADGERHPVVAGLHVLHLTGIDAALAVPGLVRIDVASAVAQQPREKVTVIPGAVRGTTAARHCGIDQRGSAARETRIGDGIVDQRLEQREKAHEEQRQEDEAAVLATLPPLVPQVLDDQRLRLRGE